MFKWLTTLSLLAVVVPYFSPDVVLKASSALAQGMFVVTPPAFLAGAGLSLLRRGAA